MRYLWSLLIVVCFFVLCGCAKQGGLEQSLQKSRIETTSITSIEVKAPKEVIRLDPLKEEFRLVKRNRPRMLEILNKKGMPPVRPEGPPGISVWVYDDPDCVRKYAFESDGSLAWAEFQPKDGKEVMSTK